jgi:hypothetical protein
MIGGTERLNAGAQNIPAPRQNLALMWMNCIKPLAALADLLCVGVDNRRTDCAANVLPWADASHLR